MPPTITNRKSDEKNTTAVAPFVSVKGLGKDTVHYDSATIKSRIKSEVWNLSL